MKSDFLLAITQLAAERNLPKEVVFSAVEAALVSAYKKDEECQQSIAVKIHPGTGDVRIYTEKTVVETPVDLKNEVSLADAKKMKPNVQLGEVVAVETGTLRAGRIAAQTAKQVVLQRLREAEREFIFGEYSDREGEVVSGIVQRIEPRQIIIDLGKTEGILPPTEQVRTERYRVGQRLKLYLLEVNRTNRGPRLVMSRSHPNLVKRLFELEVPEISNGVVELKAIAREAGFRTKVAVATAQEGVDPVGSCVGLRGIRIQNVVNELGGERIDVIQWHPQPRMFIANALSPAQVMGVEANEEERSAVAVVPDGQLSLAIGKEGQNARLAAKLTGWKIDIKPTSIFEEERAKRAALKAEEEAAVAAVERELEEMEAVAVTAPELEEEAEVVPVAEAEPEAAEVTGEIEEIEEPIAIALKEIEEAEAAIGIAEVEEEAPAKVEEEAVEAVAGKPQLRFAEDIFPKSEAKQERKPRKEDEDTAKPKVKKARQPRHIEEAEDIYEEPY